MKRKIVILLGLVLAVLLIFLSCKAPVADEAADGTAGVEDETTGAAEDSTETVIAGDEVAAADIGSCIDCHNDTTLIVSKEVQWENSVHGSGYNFERNGADCAICHTSEGYTERIEAGTFEIAADIENPSPINCRTCHDIHDTYTSDDWALTSSEPVTLELTGDVYDLGKSNLCATCHQPRPEDVPVVGGGDYEITSTRFGPHHGPQSAMIAGVGGYGDEYVGSSVHYEYVENGCVTCHMGSAFGKQAGGHTMNVSYVYHGEVTDNIAVCMECHEDIETFDRNGVQIEIEGLMEEVHGLLVAQGLIDGETGSGITGTFTSEQAGALWNYKTVEEDRSMGVHNPGYAKYLLETALEALK